MAWTNLGTVAPGDVLRANSGTAAYNNVIGNLANLRGDFASFRRTAGNVTLTGTSTWSTLTTIGTGGDLVLSALAGDLLEVGVSLLVSTEAVDVGFDPVTVVSSTVTNSFALGGAAPANWAACNGPSGFFCPSGALRGLSGSLMYTAVAGDISSSTVTLRLRYAMPGATNRTLFASSGNPFMWWARNHGPVEI